MPGSTEPTSPSMPWATAGQIVYLATYRRARRLSAAPSPASEPRRCLHDVRGLPGAQDDLADPAHRLGVGADHRDRAEVVQQVLGGDRRRPDPALGEGEVLRDGAVQVVADHEHVEVLVEGVHRVRPGRVRAAGQHVRVPGDGDDVRRVTASGTLRVVRVDAPAGDRGEGVLDEAGLVEGVAVQRHRDPVLPGHRQRGVDRRRGRAPVLVQLEAARAGPQLLDQRRPRHGVALAQQRDVDRQRVHRLEHPGQVPVARRDRGGLRALGRPGAAADQRGDARAERRRDDLRADEVHVAVDAAGGEDLAVARRAPRCRDR